MQMRVEDIDLIMRNDEDGVIRELRNIANLSISGERSVVELKIPGSDSNVFQDLGRDPVKISFDGRLVGPDTPDTLDQLRDLFSKGKVLSFSCDISPLTEVTEVVMEKFSATLKNTEPSGSEYSMVLREHEPEKGPGETPPPEQKQSAKEEVRSKVKEITSSRGSIV